MRQCLAAVRGSLAFAMFALFLSGGLAGVEAQDDDGDSDGLVDADSVQLVFEREVFTYPMFERRNPFQPQTGDDVLGPRFEDLVLLGVLINRDPTSSIAIIGARPPGATSGQTATRTFRMRRGEVVGNVRVIDIQRRQVLMEVSEFGTSETRVLEFTREPPALPPPSPFGAPGGTSVEPQAPVPDTGVVPDTGLPVVPGDAVQQGAQAQPTVETGAGHAPLRVPSIGVAV